MSDEGTSEPGDDGGMSDRLFYGVLGALAAAGLALAAAALIGLPGRGDGGGPPASDRAASSADAETRSGGSAASGSGQRSFPARYDTLGIALGPEDAPVTVREFADYQCPHCRRFAGPVKRMIEEYVESGRVRYVFFDFPITGSHPNAMAAAQAARCAGDQGAYWDMHDALFADQGEWSPASDPVPHFREYAREIGIDPERMARCVESGEKRDAVLASRKFARAIGVRSTPTALVGTEPITGAASFSRLRAMIERQLAADSTS